MTLRTVGFRHAVLLIPLLFAGCENGRDPSAPVAPPGPVATAIPLTDMGNTRYLGFAGGLYPGGDLVPPEHSRLGLERAQQIQPLGPDGRPSAGGSFVLLSIGMSNTTQEFCSAGSEECRPWTFVGQATEDVAVDHARLVIVNGAWGGQAAESWTSSDSLNYERILTTRLRPRGLTEAQVQAVWMKVADRNPEVSLPDADADAFLLERRMGEIVRALRGRYPNLRQIFISTRIYAGYATGPLNPEPFAYESGFAAKWLIGAQIEQARTGVRDSIAGDLDPAHTPWLAWGPYLWAAGTQPRSDGLVWKRADFSDDGVHPSRSGEQKVGAMLLEFFKTSPYTRCWFLVEGECS